MRKGQGSGWGWGGKGAAVGGGAWPPAPRPYQSFRGGTTDLVPDTSWASMLFSVVMLFYFLFKRSTTKTAWEVCLVLDISLIQPYSPRLSRDTPQGTGEGAGGTSRLWKKSSIPGAAAASPGAWTVRTWAWEPLPPLPIVCTDWRSPASCALPCGSGGWGAEERWGDLSVPSLGVGSQRH